MSAIDPTLLAEGAALPSEGELLAADPTGAWAALVNLRAEAVAEAVADPPLPPEVPDLDDLTTWCEQAPAQDDAVLFYARRSLLIAEQLEGCLDALAPAEGRRLAAAPDRGPVVDPWPARYAGGGWRVVLGVDESGWLYYAVEACPDGAPADGSLELPDLAHAVTGALGPGALGGIADAADLLGGHDLNPIRSIRVAGETLSREER